MCCTVCTATRSPTYYVCTVSWILYAAKRAEPLPFDWVATILKRYICSLSKCVVAVFSLFGSERGRHQLHVLLLTPTKVVDLPARPLIIPVLHYNPRKSPTTPRHTYVMLLRRLLLTATSCSLATATLSATTNVELHRLAQAHVPGSREATGDNRKRLSLQHLESMWHTSLGHEVRGSVRLCRCVGVYAGRRSISPFPHSVHYS